ncbi:MAG: four helix bundle protein [Flavobacteriales bacterium]|nr:four helix bundle protein [Flavobacteriales bacterium]MCB9364361.1 four helix bundle protein [Flavobacteriales bacterium]
MTKIYSFEKLQVWQQARLLTKEVYITTKTFPEEERFGLISQLRRASVSICSNLAEGSSRNSFKDKARFTEIAYGSLMEVLNQLIIASDLGFLLNQEYEKLRIQIEEISNMLNGLRKSQLKTHQQINP